MRKSALLTFGVLLFGMFPGSAALAATHNAVSCNTSDVQSAINAAAEGDTVTIPPGTCVWTSGVAVSGKGINITGAGSGRIIAISSTPNAVATGSMTFTVQSDRVDGTWPLGPNVGQTLRIFQTGSRGNYVQGTVTSFDSSTGSLVMNITSTGGSGSPEVWCISTIPQTSIVNDGVAGQGTPSGSMFEITEDASFHTSVSGIKFLQGKACPSCTDIQLNYSSGGQAILVHDNWFEAGGGYSQVQVEVNSGVIWDNSFDSSPFEQGGGENSAMNVTLPASSGTLAKASWSTPSTWGDADTTGQAQVYFETNDVHAYLTGTTADDGGRMVVRYNFFDNASAYANHGADSSPYGARYAEIYKNTFIFEARSGQTFNLTQGWIFSRGGTLVAWGNSMPNIDSSDTGQKSNFIAAAYALQTPNTPSHDGCWGAGFTTHGQYYPAPRQFGLGYVTGTGTVNYPADGYNNTSTDSLGAYVGDSEPVYIWGNTGTGTSGGGITNIGYSDGGLSCSNPDSSRYYIQAGRDYFNGTAKPGYTPYAYPHPLTGGVQTAQNGPAAPTNLQGTLN